MLRCARFSLAHGVLAYSVWLLGTYLYAISDQPQAISGSYLSSLQTELFSDLLAVSH